MRRLLLGLAALAALTLPITARADFGVLENFGPNPLTACINPEGIAIDPTGNLYAASFGNGHICVVDRSGSLVDDFAVAAGAAGVTALLGELFEPSQGLYVVDFANGAPGNGRLLRIDPATHAVTVLAVGMQAPNAIAQDRHRNLFVSDSFAGRIYRIPAQGTADVSQDIWIEDARLRTNGFPPFGANGVAFDRNQDFLYVANTGDSKVLRIAVRPDGSAGALTTFADHQTISTQGLTSDPLHGADGIMFDVHQNLYVCANQANEIQVVSPDGTELVAVYRGSGATGLDFPASLVFKGRQLYITNLSLFDGGVNSKLSVVEVPHPGLPLRP
jgi:sugar lactone lactonase YvrE